jgi:hypothetical protein
MITRYLAQWQAEVRVVMEKSVHRHTWITRITRILHYCESAGLFNGNEAERQGRDNSSYGHDASLRRSNDHNVSRGSGQASWNAFSIARLDADHPVPPRLSRQTVAFAPCGSLPQRAR